MCSLDFVNYVLLALWHFMLMMTWLSVCSEPREMYRKCFDISPNCKPTAIDKLASNV